MSKRKEATESDNMEIDMDFKLIFERPKMAPRQLSPPPTSLRSTHATAIGSKEDTEEKNDMDG